MGKNGAGYIVSSFAGAEEFVVQVTFSFILSVCSFSLGEAKRADQRVLFNNIYSRMLMMTLAMYTRIKLLSFRICLTLRLSQKFISSDVM